MDEMRQIGTGLSRLAMAMRVERWKQADASGLSPVQAEIVTFIHARGALTQMVLAELLGVTQPTVSDAIAALKRKGLVEALANPSDARSRVLVLSDAGMTVAATVSEMPDRIADALRGVAEADRPALARALSEMIGGLQRNGAVAPQRMCAGCAFFRPDAYPGAAKPHHCDFVDAAFGDADRRFDCSDFHEAGEVQMG
jgi:DNA-binding MarR family transcriptional regulator